MATRSHALTDCQWTRIAALFDRPQRPGGQWKDHRIMLDGVLWILKTGSPWRDLPDRFGPWKTVYDRFRRWRTDSTLDRVAARLQQDLGRDGLIDWFAFCIDSTSVRASREPEKGRRGRARS